VLTKNGGYFKHSPHQKHVCLEFVSTPSPMRRYSLVIKKAEKSIRSTHQRLFPHSAVPQIYLQRPRSNRKEVLDNTLIPDDVLRQFVPEIVSSTSMMISQLVCWMLSNRKSDAQALKSLGTTIWPEHLVVFFWGPGILFVR